jgi:hypothetical protein
LTDADELKEVAYDACEVFWSKIRGVDLHVMSRTGPRDVVEERTQTVQDGLDIAERIVSPNVLQVQRVQHFGPRSRAYGRTRPSIPYREPRRKSL